METRLLEASLYSIQCNICLPVSVGGSCLVIVRIVTYLSVCPFPSVVLDFTVSLSGVLTSPGAGPSCSSSRAVFFPSSPAHNYTSCNSNSRFKIIFASKRATKHYQ